MDAKLKKRRKKQSNPKSAPRSEKKAEQASTDKASAVPLVGTTPPDPPKKNLTFLVSVLAVFAVWVGFLIWLCFAG